MNTNHYHEDPNGVAPSAFAGAFGSVTGAFGSQHHHHTGGAFGSQHHHHSGAAFGSQHHHHSGGAFGSYGGGFVSHSGGFGSSGAFGPHGTLEPNVALPYPLLPTQRSLQQQSVHPHSIAENIAVAVAAAAPELPVQQDDDVDIDESAGEEENHDENVSDDEDEQEQERTEEEDEEEEQEDEEDDVDEDDDAKQNVDNDNAEDVDVKVDVDVDEQALGVELEDLRRRIEPLEIDHDKVKRVVNERKLVLDEIRLQFEKAQKEHDIVSMELEKIHNQLEPCKLRECDIHKTLQGHRGALCPIDRDVLCGVYAKDSHKGNKWYMEEIRRFRPEYNELTCKADKAAFVRERVVLRVYERGGRFLESKKLGQDGEWREISIEDACVRAGRTVRRNRMSNKTGPTGSAVDDVRDADVLYITRWNSKSKEHPGNQAYFTKLQELLPEFRSVKTSLEKNYIVRRVIEDVNGRNGRFLWKRVPKDPWLELSFDESFIKVRDAFWEANRKGKRGNVNIMLLPKEEREKREAQRLEEARKKQAIRDEKQAIRDEKQAIRDEKRRLLEAKKKERMELVERKKAVREAAAAATAAVKRRKKEVEAAATDAKAKTLQQNGKKRQRVSTGNKKVVAVTSTVTPAPSTAVPPGDHVPILPSPSPPTQPQQLSLAPNVQLV